MALSEGQGDRATRGQGDKGTKGILPTANQERPWAVLVLGMMPNFRLTIFENWLSFFKITNGIGGFCSMSVRFSEERVS